MAKSELMQALSLTVPAKVPRTEYSVECHWPLLQKVTGVNTADPALRPLAQAKFFEKWDYGFVWSILVHKHFLREHGGRATDMGHAVYLADGSDFNDQIFCPFATPEEALALDPCREYGEFAQTELIRRFEADYQKQSAHSAYPARMSGVYISMFSGLIEIYGFEMLLLLMGMYPKEFGKVIDGYYQWVRQFFEAYARTDIPVMMVHDDLCWTEGPVTHPEWYRQYIFPYLKQLIAPVKAAGKKVIFTSDGTIDVFFDDFIALDIDMLVMEPTSDIREFARRHGQRCAMAGGMDCRVVQYAEPAELERQVRSMLEFGKQYPGFVFASGNHLPPDLPVESCLRYQEYFEKYAYR